MYKNDFTMNWYSGLLLLLQIRYWDGFGFENKIMKRNVKKIQFFLLNSILDGVLLLPHEFVFKFTQIENV